MEAVSAEIVINNHSGLSTRLLNLLTSKDLCDVQLQVGQHIFDAHKLILCASSDVFKAMLTNHKWTEAHKQSVILIEEPVCEPVFGRFVNYIYSGQLYISHSTVCPLLTLADKYNVRELIPLCRTYMMENLDAPIASSCVLQWWENANMRNDAELEAKILHYIENNFNKVIQSPDFVSACLDTVDKLLASSKLAVHNEAIIFYGVMVWLQAYMNFQYPPPHKIKEAFHRLTCHIRWSMMKEDEIRCLRLCRDVQGFLETYGSLLYVPNMTSSIHSNIFGLIKDKTASSFEFSESSSGQNTHCNNILALLTSGEQSSSLLLYEERENDGLKVKPETTRSELFMPRVYISDYWCTTLTVSNFLAFPQYATLTFFFSTPRTGYRYDDGHTLDWEVELSPKGVHFPPAILIGLERDGNKLVDESYVHTVRLSVMSRSVHELPLKVEVNVLVRANSLSEPCHSFVERSHRRTCIFDSKHQRHNLDDIVPYEKYGTYLHPDGLIPALYTTPSLAFTVYIVIRPLL